MPQGLPSSQSGTNSKRGLAARTDRGAATGHRLTNLAKLYQVPVFALRALVERAAPGQDLGGLRQAELVRRADTMPEIHETDVDGLYESARYGQQLAFYLYLLPTGMEEPGMEELQAFLDNAVARDRTCGRGKGCSCHDYECESCPRQVRLLDDERWDSFRELRFRYYVSHRFLNADERADEVLQSRYGFLWLDLTQGYLVILTRDEQVKGLLIGALESCLRTAPVAVHFPKELIDKHFSIEKAKQLSYYDPGTGVRRCISGYGLWQRFEQEIAAREQQYTRPSSLYDEEVAQGIVSGLEVLATKGKMLLTRTLPTSVVRTWARQRLPDLMRDVRELQAYQPQALGQPMETVRRLRLPSASRATINLIVQALLQVAREDVTSVGLPYSALEIYDSLAGRYFQPYLRGECSQCAESAELCPECESQDVVIEGKTVRCGACGATLSDNGPVTLHCMRGHATTIPLAQAWDIAPNHWLQKRMARIFADLGKVWDESNDYFYIEGKTLYRLRKGKIDTTCLPPVVQNYISNFWDPVSGQVHTGSGQIVNGGGNGSQPPASVEALLVPMAALGSPIPANEEPKEEGEGTMLRRDDIRPTVTYTPTFHGPIYGPAHMGSGNLNVQNMSYGLQVDDLAALFAGLSKTVQEQAPAEKKPEAMQKVAELKSAIQSGKPDVNRMESVLDWFKKYVPQLAGAVTSVIVNPIVGRLVEAAGDAVVEAFRRRFSQA